MCDILHMYTGRGGQKREVVAAALPAAPGSQGFSRQSGYTQFRGIVSLPAHRPARHWSHWSRSWSHCSAQVVEDPVQEMRDPRVHAGVARLGASVPKTEIKLLDFVQLN